MKGVKRPCWLQSGVSLNQWWPQFRVSITALFSAGYSSPELPFRLCPTVCFMETVILEHVSPTPAGSAHWTGSSSGGRPESHPSLTTH